MTFRHSGESVFVQFQLLQPFRCRIVEFVQLLWRLLASNGVALVLCSSPDHLPPARRRLRPRWQIVPRPLFTLVLTSSIVMASFRFFALLHASVCSLVILLVIPLYAPSFSFPLVVWLSSLPFLVVFPKPLSLPFKNSSWNHTLWCCISLSRCFSLRVLRVTLTILALTLC